MMMRVVAAATLFLTGCDVLAPCTLVGCYDGVRVEIGPLADPARYLGGIVTMCQNDQCATVALSDMLPAARTSTTAQASGELPVSVLLWNLESEYRIDVELYLPKAALENGDEYTIEIRDPANANAVVFEHAWTADYESFYPNGEGCDEGCMVQRLHLSETSAGR